MKVLRLPFGLSSNNAFVCRRCHHSYAAELHVRSKVQRRSPIVLRGIVSRFDEKFLHNTYVHQWKHNQTLRKYCSQYKSVDSDDLFRTFDRHHISVSHGFDLVAIMRPWIDQPGYPIVTVTRNYEQGTVFFSQNSSTSILNGVNSTTDDNTWFIPINCVTEYRPNFKNTSATIWLKPTGAKVGSCDLFNSKINRNYWFIINKQQTGL